MLAGEAAIFATAYFTDISLLWYNVIGCVVVMVRRARDHVRGRPDPLPPHQIRQLQE